MKYTNLKIRLLALLLLAATCATAQTTPAEIAAHPERSAGIYHSYEYRPGPADPAPKGYVPFYISHYGRHGSRYHSTEVAYKMPLTVLRKAAEAGVLTPKGQEVLKKVETLAEDAHLRYGDLSPRGIQEHRDIAERMFNAYPQVFSTKGGRTAHVQSRSTLVPRCILSMAAFNERLKELNPQIDVTRESSARYLNYIAHGPSMTAISKETERVADSVCHARLRTEQFVNRLVTDPSYVENPQKFMRRLHMLSAITQDVNHLGVEPFYDIFTNEELYTLWECENARRYLQMGPSVRFGGPIVADAKPLLRNIIETAQEVIDGKSDLSASLRFGHDVFVIPLVALLGVEGASSRVDSPEDIASSWSVEKVSPMATNVQFIFFRNPSTGDVRVRVMHNERDVKIPLAGGPYYPWKELKAYCESLYNK